MLLITEAALSAELGRNESRPDPRPLHAIRNHLYLPVRYHSFGQISFPGTTPTLVTRAFSPSILLLITEAALSAELGRNESRPDPRPLHAIRNHLYLPVRYHSFGQISFPGTTPTLVTRAFSPSILLLITEAALSAELGRNESRPDPRPLHAIRNHLYLPVRYHSFGQISFPGTTPTLVTRAFSPSILLLITEAALSAELGRNESRPDPRPLHAIRNHLYLPVRYHSFGQISFPGTTPTLVTRAFSPSILLLITEAALSAELGRNESRPDPRPLHAIRNHLYLPVRYHSFGQISFPGTTPTLVTRAFSPLPGNLIYFALELSVESRPDPRPLHAIRNLPVRYHSFGQISFPGTTPTLVTRAFSPSILLLITEAALSAELGRNESRPDPRPLHAIRNHLYLPVRLSRKPPRAHLYLPGQISFPGTTPTLVTRAFSPSILLLITEAALSAELGRNESRPDPRPLHAIRNHLYLPVRYHSFGQISFPGTTPTLVTRAFSPSILLLITEAALSAELGRNESRPDPRPLHAIRNHLYLPVRYHSFGQISFPGTTPTLVTRAFSPSILLLITEAALSAELGRNESRPDPRPLHAIRNHLYLPVRYHSFGQISFPGTTPTLVTRAFSPSILLLITEAALSAELGRNESRPDPRPLHAIRNHLYLPVRYHSFGQISFPGTTPTLVTRAFSPSILLLITEAALSAELGRNESRPDPRPLHAIRNHLYLPVRYHSFGQISFPGTTPTLVTRAFSPSILLLITEAALSAELGRNESRPDPRPLHAIRNHLYLPVRYHSFGQISFPGTTPTLVTRAFSPSILLLITEAALSAELGRNESRPDPRPLHAIRNHLYLPVRYHSFGQISFPGTTPTLVTRAFSPSILLLITEAALSAELGRNESRPDPRPLHAIRNHLYLPVRYHSFGQISFPGTTPTLVTRAFSPSILLLITEAALSAELGRNESRPDPRPLHAIRNHLYLPVRYHSFGQISFPGTTPTLVTRAFSPSILLLITEAALSAELGRNESRPDPRPLHAIRNHLYLPVRYHSFGQISFPGTTPTLVLPVRYHSFGQISFPGTTPTLVTRLLGPFPPAPIRDHFALDFGQISFPKQRSQRSSQLGRNESRPDPRPLHAIRNHLYLPVRYHSFGQISFPGTTPTLVTRAFSPSILLLITEAALETKAAPIRDHCTRSGLPKQRSQRSWAETKAAPIRDHCTRSGITFICQFVITALAKSVFRGPHRP